MAVSTANLIIDVPEDALGEFLDVRIRGLNGLPAETLQTSGGGHCALNAGWGDVQVEGGERCYRLPRARRFLQKQIGNAYMMFKQRVSNDNLVSQIFQTLWNDEVKPCVLFETGASARIPSREGKLLEFS